MSKEREEFEKAYQEIWDKVELEGDEFQVKHLMLFKLEVQRQHDEENLRLQRQQPFGPYTQIQKGRHPQIYTDARTYGLKATIAKARKEREEEEIKKYGSVRPEEKQRMDNFEKKLFPPIPEIAPPDKNSRMNNFQTNKDEIAPHGRSLKSELAEKYRGRDIEPLEPTKEDPELDRG